MLKIIKSVSQLQVKERVQINSNIYIMYTKTTTLFPANHSEITWSHFSIPLPHYWGMVFKILSRFCKVNLFTHLPRVVFICILFCESMQPWRFWPHLRCHWIFMSKNVFLLVDFLDIQIWFKFKSYYNNKITRISLELGAVTRKVVK